MRVSRRWVMAGFRLVGLLAALRPGIGTADLSAAASLIGPATTGVLSPWATSANLAQVVWSDIFGAGAPVPLTRAEAMRVPAVARARHIICGTIARVELGDYRGETRLPADQQARWITAGGPLSPLHRMLMTADDVLFYGWSLWRRTNAAASDGGFPLRMDRVPIGAWELEADTGRVLLLDPDPDHPGNTRRRVALRDEVVLIAGPHGGLLEAGAPAIRHAADLDRAAHNAGKFPSAYLGLKQTSGTPLKRRSDDPTEVTVETVLADWRTARTNPEGGGVAWLGGVEPAEFGSFDAHLLTEGRNAAAIDVARHASLPADLVDATLSQSSLQYSTSRDNDRRGVDYGLGFYMSAITACLSVDGVHPHGRTVAFDVEKWLQGSAPVPGQEPATPAPGMTPPPTTETPA